jgi:hypothetical protein
MRRLKLIASSAEATPDADVSQPLSQLAEDWLPEQAAEIPSEFPEPLSQTSPAPSADAAEPLEPAELPDPSAAATDDASAPAATVPADGEDQTEPQSALTESPENPERLDDPAQAARAAGLVAPRELNDAPAYNRWAAGTLTGGQSTFGAPPARRAVWPFVVVAGLLLLALAAQLLQHFRTEVVRWWPDAAPYYALAGLAIPLSRNPELVAIEASDLQSDNVRGLFVLQATLHNRAPYPQAWPALELTLTDAGDTVVSRRVMSAAEYLPPAISPEIFPANGEVAVRLWIEARDIGAAGYRLYVFYP